MSTDNKKEIGHSGLYERTVDKITHWVKPYLHQTTQEFVARSVNKYAKDNPRFARMIEFEVRRRGDGAGLTQDVSEPLLWAVIKTLAALAIVIPVEFIKNRKWILVERAAAAGILLNNAVELFRLVPRYKAGLQGSLEMAKDRWRSIEESGVDPFNNQQAQREINSNIPESAFAKSVHQRAAILPTSLKAQADAASPPVSPSR